MPNIKVNKMVLFAILAVAFSHAKEICWDLSERVEKERRILKELLQTQSELDTKFKSAVTEDFDAQVDETFETITQLRRDKAIKLAFARRKVAENIEAKRVSIDTLIKSYCSKCARLAKQADRRAQYCATCSDTPACIN